MAGLSCYILADTFFIARAMGAEGLAALNFSISIYSIIHGIGLIAKRVFLEPPDRSTESHWRAEIRAGGAGPRAIEANTNIKSHLS